MPTIALLVLIVVCYFLYYYWLKYTKDAPFVPMDADVVARLVRVAQIGDGDVFYDLGCGDGRLVIAASMAGAKAKGVELDKLRSLYARFWIKILRLRGAEILNANLFNVDLSDATVVCTYLLPSTHQKLKKKLKKELKKGARVVAVGFVYDGWKPIRVDPRGTIYGPIMVYRM